MMVSRGNWLDLTLIVFILTLLLCWDNSVCAKKKKGSDITKKCETCRDLVKKFNEGIERTERYNFAGGDVDWEEKKLGSYATSETRFIEITERLCASSAHEYAISKQKSKKKKTPNKEEPDMPDDMGDYDVDLHEMKCHTMLEENEEKIEDWWKNHQESDPDLELYLCIDGMKVCCPDNRYGPNCDECIGGLERPCRDNGKCSGSGTRGGTGKCKCNGGYKGWYCEVCKNGFYEELKNDTHTVCKACDDACASTCTGAGPKACAKCKGGYVQDEEEGCKDIDECDKETQEYPCDVQKEYCENTRGSYKCNKCDGSCNRCLGKGNDMCISCKDGYKLDEGSCIDIDECEQEDQCEAIQHMSCNNLPGSFYCDCKEGYERMGEECIDKEIAKALKQNKMHIPDPDIGIKENGENIDTNADENKANINIENESLNIQPPFQEDTNQQQPTKDDSIFQTHQDIVDTKDNTAPPTQSDSKSMDPTASSPQTDSDNKDTIVQADSDSNSNNDVIDNVNNSHQSGNGEKRTPDADTDNSQNNEEIREEL